MRNLSGVLSLVLISLVLLSCGGNSGPSISLIPVQNGKDFQYIDKEGKIIINPQFAVASVFREGLALVKTSGDKGKFGFINEDGKYEIAANYKDGTVFSEGLAWVVSENGAPTAIDSKGEVKITLQDAETVKIFRDGLAAFSILKDGEYQWGFVDKEGKVIISPQFSATGNFSEGKCEVLNKDGKWGYVDAEGKLIINYQFDAANKFVDGQAAVGFDGKAGAIDENGKYVINPQFDEIRTDGDLYAIRQGDKWGWSNREGEIIINPQFESVYSFSGGESAPVKMGKDWGYVDKEGKVKINPQFDEINYDLLFYLIYDGTFYESVTSDYFNIAPILSRINLSSPEGLTLGSTLGDLIKKVNVKEEIFNQYRDTHLVLENIPLTSDATVNFSVQAKSHKEVEDGWYLVSVFNPSAPITGFSYTINLSGKGYSKADQVLAAIEKGIKGFKKDEADPASKDWTVYTNGTQKIYLNMNGPQVNVWVMKAQ